MLKANDRPTRIRRPRLSPRFDRLESREMPTVGVSQIPLESWGGSTQGIAASSTLVWATEGNNAIASIDPATYVSTQYPIPTPNSDPRAIAAGPDGNTMWFLEYGANKIGRVDPVTHAVTDYPVPSASASLAGITAGPANQVWFTESRLNKVGVINTTTRAISEFPLPGSNLSGPNGIVYGPDGNLWIADTGQNQIVSFNPTTHAAKIYSLGGGGSDGITGIAVGPDRNLWFTEDSANVIDVFNPTTRQFAAPIAMGGWSDPGGITAGPDGNIWITCNHFGYGGVGVYNLATHKFAGFLADDPVTSAPDAITIAPGGAKALWIDNALEGNGGQVFRFTTAGAMTPVTIPAKQAGLPDYASSVASDLSGNIWFTRPNAGLIGVYNPKTNQTAEYPVALTACRPDHITLDPVNGALYFTATYAAGRYTALDKVDPTTHAISYLGTLPKPNATAVDLKFNAKFGNFWFLDASNHYIGSVNPATNAIVDNYDLSIYAKPNSFTIDGAGTLWIADSATVYLEQYSPATHVYTLLKNVVTGTPASIVADAKGNIWFMVPTATGLSEYTPSTGKLTRFGLLNPFRLVFAPDGNLWYIGRSNIVGVVNVTTHASATYSANAGSLFSIVLGVDGNIWFTGSGFGSNPGNYLGRIQTS